MKRKSDLPPLYLPSLLLFWCICPGKTFDQIADLLNKKVYLSVRGRKFKGNHVHSIMKKKRLKDEKLEIEFPEVRSDFSLEVVDKTLVIMFQGL